MQCGASVVVQYPALGRIQSLIRAQRFMYHDQTAIEKLFEELKDIPPEVDQSAPFVPPSFLAQASFRAAP
jgi:hypothetical protein